MLAREPRHGATLHLLGIVAAQIGRPDVAADLIQRALAINPGDAAAMADLGNALHASGRVDEAIAAFEESVRLKPDSAPSCTNLGHALRARGRIEDAIAAYTQAVQADEGYLDALCSLGAALHAAGRFEQAAAAFRRAVQAKPGSAELQRNLGAACHSASKWEESIAAYREAIRFEPGDPEVHKLLGNALKAAGRFAEASAAYQQALALRPEDPDLQQRLGDVFRANSQFQDAVSAYRAALQLKPKDAEILCHLGIAFQANGQPAEAIPVLRQAIHLKPDLVLARNFLGIALQDLGEMDEALAACREAIQVAPDCAEAYNNLGNVLHGLDRFDLAVDAYRHALQIDPGHPGALHNLGNSYQRQGMHDLAVEYFRKAVGLNPRAADIHSGLVYALCFNPRYGAEEISAECRRWNDQHARPFEARRCPHENDRSPERRLRVGYVSPDFRQHVVGSNILSLLREHRRDGFDVFCYANVSKPDALTGQLQSMADHWRDIVGLSDEAVAEMIRGDAIDILVDLSLHTAHNRLPVFARKPAPVQVTYLGYCGTTGLTAIDYRLSDPYLDPPGRELVGYNEKTARLPRSYWCYEPLGPSPPISAVPAVRAGHVTFGGLTNFAKVSDDALELWASILAEVPGSQLLLYTPVGGARQRVVARFSARGLDPERLEFVGMQSWEKYIETFCRVDVALDPFPYGGGISSCDALWMGVPIVTLSGKTAVGRGGRSLLSNLGLPELIAQTPPEYVAKAVALAHDLPQLNELRSTLRERMERSPLRDAKRHARDIEVAYRGMWRKWCAEKEAT